MSQSVLNTDISTCTNNYIHDTFITEPSAIFFKVELNKERLY